MTSLAERRREVLDSMMREAVYEGAVAVLTEYGLNGMTMDRVAAAAGTAKGSLYKCFPNKHELLKFVHNRAVAPMQDALMEIVEDRISAPEKLKSIVQMWREHLDTHHALFEFLINDHVAKGLLKGTDLTARAVAIERIAVIVQQGMEEGTIRHIDATQVAEMFLGATIGMVEQELALGRSRPVGETVNTFMSVFLHGLCVSDDR